MNVQLENEVISSVDTSGIRQAHVSISVISEDSLSSHSLSFTQSPCVSVYELRPSSSFCPCSSLCPSHHGLWSFVPQHGVWVPRLLQQVPGGVSCRQDDHEGQHGDPWQAQRSGVHPADRRLPHPLLLEGSDNRERGWCRWHNLNVMLARPESECKYEPFLLFSLRTSSSSLMTASSSGWTSAPPDEFMFWSSRLAPKDSSSGCRYVSERSVTHGCVHEV